jgi:hypothetical protein
MLARTPGHGGQAGTPRSQGWRCERRGVARMARPTEKMAKCVVGRLKETVMAMDGDIDYSGFSFKELEEALERIHKDRFSLNYQR